MQERDARARRQLLDLVSHDLKNPLSAIELSTAALLDAHDSPSGERRLRSARSLVRLQRAAARMSHLVDDLLNVAGIEAGNFTLDARALELPALVAEAADALRPQAAAKAVALEVVLPAKLPTVSADPVRLQQVLGNLLGNAIKFTPPQGKVTVGAEVLDGEVRFWVADTGPGLAPQELERVFDRFWQAMRHRRAGSGLGLFIVKGLVEAMGGKVWAESTPGAGSRFSFTLQIAGSALGAAAVPAAPPEDARVSRGSLQIPLSSHHLRGALTTLELQLERLQRESDSSLTDRQQLALRRITGATRRLGELTEDALGRALEHQARGRPSLHPIDVRALAAEVLEALQPDAEARQLTLKLDAPLELPALESDRELLRLGLDALMVRAMKSSQGGTVELSLKVSDGSWRASVTASGAPLQAGADLHLVERVAALLGGRLEAAGPLDPVRALVFSRGRANGLATAGLLGALPAPRAARPLAPAPLILIVEDDPEIREELTDLLREEGYDVDAVTDATEAQRRFDRFAQAPDLILLDLMMPGGDGWQFRQAQLADPALAAIPVVLLSGAGDVKSAASELGTAAYVAKPFKLETLLGVVRRLCPLPRSASAQRAAGR